MATPSAFNFLEIKPTLSELLLNVIHIKENNWYQFGVQLGIGEKSLDDISLLNSPDSNKLIKVLQLFIEKPHAKRSDVLKGLRKINENDVADRYEQSIKTLNPEWKLEELLQEVHQSPARSRSDFTDEAIRLYEKFVELLRNVRISLHSRVDLDAAKKLVIAALQNRTTETTAAQTCYHNCLSEIDDGNHLISFLTDHGFLNYLNYDLLRKFSRFLEDERLRRKLQEYNENYAKLFKCALFPKVITAFDHPHLRPAAVAAFPLLKIKMERRNFEDLHDLQQFFPHSLPFPIEVKEIYYGTGFELTYCVFPSTVPELVNYYQKEKVAECFNKFSVHVDLMLPDDDVAKILVPGTDHHTLIDLTSIHVDLPLSSFNQKLKEVIIRDYYSSRREQEPNERQLLEAVTNMQTGLDKFLAECHDYHKERAQHIVTAIKEAVRQTFSKVYPHIVDVYELTDYICHMEQFFIEALKSENIDGLEKFLRRVKKEATKLNDAFFDLEKFLTSKEAFIENVDAIVEDIKRNAKLKANVGAAVGVAGGAVGVSGGIGVVGSIFGFIATPLIFPVVAVAGGTATAVAGYQMYQFYERKKVCYEAAHLVVKELNDILIKGIKKKLNRIMSQVDSVDKSCSVEHVRSLMSVSLELKLYTVNYLSLPLYFKLKTCT